MIGFCRNILDASISGELALAGEMKGDLHSFQLQLDTRLGNTAIDGMFIDNIQGSLEVRNGGLLSVQQLVTVSEGQTLRINGMVDLKKEKKADGRMELRAFPWSCYLPWIPSFLLWPDSLATWPSVQDLLNRI